MRIIREFRSASLFDSWKRAAVLLLLVLLGTGAGPRERARPRRAKPPVWSRDALDTFFEDARDALVGKRPDYGAAGAAVGKPTPDGGASGSATGDSPSAPADGAFRWSALVSHETIEDEIKRLREPLAPLVKTPGEFKGRGFQDCRSHFTWLAALFGVASEYDGDVRWKRDAAMLRDLFARAGRNCKVGTDGSFNEARDRVEDLAEIIRGGRPDGPPAAEDPSWPDIAERPPLMKRLEVAFEERIDTYVANAGDFRKHGAEIEREAEVVAVIAEIIARDGYEFADDDEFRAYANALRTAARDVVDSARMSDYRSARDAAGRIFNACNDCHEDYRN